MGALSSQWIARSARRNSGCGRPLNSVVSHHVRADVISAIAAVAAAVVSIVAVAIAARSARAAEASAKAATATLRRGAVRELINLCHDVLAENLRIIDLGPTLKSEYTSLFVLAGTSGGSRETTLKATLAQDLAAAEDLSREAVTLGDDLGKLHSTSDEDIDQMSTRLIRARTRLRAIRESIELELSQARADADQLRKAKA